MLNFPDNLISCLIWLVNLHKFPLNFFAKKGRKCSFCVKFFAVESTRTLHGTFHNKNTFFLCLRIELAAIPRTDGLNYSHKMCILFMCEEYEREMLHCHEKKEKKMMMMMFLYSFLVKICKHEDYF